MPSPDKFKKTLEKYQVNQEIVEEIYTGFGNLKSRTDMKTKAAFFKQALEIMNTKLSKKGERNPEANACCKSGQIEPFSIKNRNNSIVSLITKYLVGSYLRW